MIEAGHIAPERRQNARSPLALRALFWLLALLAIGGTPLGAGNGWASAPEIARAAGVSEPHAHAHIESDKSYVEEAKLLSFASKSEAGDDAFVTPPQGFPNAGSSRDCAHTFPLLLILQHGPRSFDAQAPPHHFSLA
jgi:hypothetical protein